jgi:hypothetical protein
MLEGEPTKKAMALKKWGFGSVEAARNFLSAQKNKSKKKVTEKTTHLDKGKYALLTMLEMTYKLWENY